MILHAPDNFLMTQLGASALYDYLDKQGYSSPLAGHIYTPRGYSHSPPTGSELHSPTRNGPSYQAGPLARMRNEYQDFEKVQEQEQVQQEVQFQGHEIRVKFFEGNFSGLPINNMTTLFETHLLWRTTFGAFIPIFDPHTCACVFVHGMCHVIDWEKHALSDMPTSRHSWKVIWELEQLSVHHYVSMFSNRTKGDMKVFAGTDFSEGDSDVLQRYHLRNLTRTFLETPAKLGKMS